ncbi:MAG TPA: hypothetical protein VKZ42_04945, partial [Flavobacteriaceae bacterium]|nr:hypothetical protein [Flavobacteriaceae bacterium]
MKKITFMLLFAVFAFGTGYAQKGTKDALKEQNNYTSSKSVSVTDAMLDKKSNQSAVVFKNQQTAQVEELLARLNALGTQTGSISEYFTAAEIQVLSNHLKAANGVSKNAVTRGSDTRGGGTTAYGINNAGPNFGHFDHLNPTVFNAVSGGSGTSGFEGAGAISFDDP